MRINLPLLVCLSLILLGAFSWDYNNPFKKLVENLDQEVM